MDSGLTWISITILQSHVFSLLQTGCSPASAFASFSKRLASPPREDGLSRNASGLMRSLPDTLASNIPTFPRSVSPASYSPPASPLEGDVVIPCEFCGVALEEAVVFHHQVCHLKWWRWDIYQSDSVSRCLEYECFVLWCFFFFFSHPGQMWYAPPDCPSAEQPNKSINQETSELCQWHLWSDISRHSKENQAPR